MENRTYIFDDYRFGFNGKEADTEGEWGTQTHYDYGFRIYNPSIARFLSVDPLSPDYPWYTPYQFAGNMPIWAIDLDGLEEYLVTYEYNGGVLSGLEIKLTNLNADYIIKRNRYDANERSVEYNPGKIGYIPSVLERNQENGFFRLLRRRGVLGSILRGNRPFGPFKISTPMRLPNSIGGLAQIPSLGLEELSVPQRELGVSPTPVARPISKPEKTEEVISIARYGSWEDIPSNLTTVLSELGGLIDKLEADPELTLTIEANVGGGKPTDDPRERATFGRSSLELAEARAGKMVRYLRREAKKVGLDENRISGSVGSDRSKSVKFQFF